MSACACAYGDGTPATKRMVGDLSRCKLATCLAAICRLSLPGATVASAACPAWLALRDLPRPVGRYEAALDSARQGLPTLSCVPSAPGPLCSLLSSRWRISGDAPRCWSACRCRARCLSPVSAQRASDSCTCCARNAACACSCASVCTALRACCAASRRHCWRSCWQACEASHSRACAPCVARALPQLRKGSTWSARAARGDACARLQAGAVAARGSRGCGVCPGGPADLSESVAAAFHVLQARTAEHPW